MVQPAPGPAPLKTKLNDDLKQALKGGNRVAVSTIRMVISALKYAEIARQAELTDGDILGIIQKEVKQREESIAAFKQGNRPDLAANEAAEMAILKAYLPRQMSRDEIVAEAKRVIAEVGAQGQRDKSKVMPKLVASLKGKADGKEINAVVTQLLSQG